MCTRPAAKHAGIIAGIKFTVESCVRERHFSKGFVHWRWERSWLVCQREEGDPNNGYGIAVKTDTTRTVQIKYNNDLSSF